MNYTAKVVVAKPQPLTLTAFPCAMFADNPKKRTRMSLSTSLRVGIVNFAKGGWYPAGQERLRSTLSRVGYSGATYFFKNENDFNSPSHQQVPYVFKLYALERALEDKLDTIFWMDSSVWANRGLQRLIDYVNEKGHVFFDSGFRNDQWTNDNCFDLMGREGAEGPMFMACCFGLCLQHTKTMEFIKEWISIAKEKPSCFQGSWSNHRHDQSVGSILAYRYGMKTIAGHLPEFDFFQYYANTSGTTYQYDRNDNDMSLVRPEMLLYAQGL